jgi:hypothetical protein
VVVASRKRNELLAEAVAEAGWTREAAAAAVRAVATENGECLQTNKSAVDHWIKGAQPKGNAARYLTEALSRRLGRMLLLSDLGLLSSESGDDPQLGLSLGPDAVGVLARMWRADLGRRRFLATAAYSVAGAVLPLEHVQEIALRTDAARKGAVAGKAEVTAVRDMIQMFTVMDERHGGQHGRSALVQYLMSDVATLCRGRFRTEEDRAAMVSAAASGVHLAGWKAYDAGEQGLAQRYYLQSYSLAHESGVTGHDAFVMRTMSQQGMKLRRPEHCLALAEVAVGRVHGRVDPHVEALFEITRANALAQMGQRHEAIQAIRNSQSLVESAQVEERHSGHRPGGLWMRWCIPAQPEHSRSWAIGAALKTNTPLLRRVGRPGTMRAFSPSTWSRRPRCSTPKDMSSRRAPRGGGRSTVWRACSRSEPAGPLCRCARASSRRGRAESGPLRNWTNAPRSSCPADDDRRHC